MRDRVLKLPDLTSINRGVHVLLVDDDDLYVGMVERALDEDKRVATVSRARDGADAEAFLEREGWPDLVITDLAMPKTDGLTFLRRLREVEAEKNLMGEMTRRRVLDDEERPLLPVVVMTSSEKALDYHRVVEAVGNSFITKPDKAGDLKRLLRALIRSVIWGETLPPILDIDALSDQPASMAACG